MEQSLVAVAAWSNNWRMVPLFHDIQGRWKSRRRTLEFSKQQSHKRRNGKRLWNSFWENGIFRGRDGHGKTVWFMTIIHILAINRYYDKGYKCGKLAGKRLGEITGFSEGFIRAISLSIEVYTIKSQSEEFLGYLTRHGGECKESSSRDRAVRTLEQVLAICSQFPASNNELSDVDVEDLVRKLSLKFRHCLALMKSTEIYRKTQNNSQQWLWIITLDILEFTDSRIVFQTPAQQLRQWRTTSFPCSDDFMKNIQYMCSGNLRKWKFIWVVLLGLSYLSSKSAWFHRVRI